MKLVPVGTYGTLFVAMTVGLGMFAAKPESPAKAEYSKVDGSLRPVLLELFTSEGCSSCPPADRLLETLDRTQPVSGAELIVLSEHVDYWNRLGWADPFSLALFTQRQQDYVKRLHLDSAYTPQLVVDGQKDVIGSDERAARAAILKAETHAKAAIDLRAERSGADVRLGLRVAAVAPGTDVYVVLADDHARSQVARGENSGHTLEHVAVVRSLLLAGKSDAQGAFSKNLTLPLEGGNGGAWRVVVFLQDHVSKQILGAVQAHV